MSNHTAQNPFAPGGSLSGGSSQPFGKETNAGIKSIVNDTNARSLPSIIESFRKGRLSLGYEDPTYFGFAMDIHCQDSEASNIYNPYTGLRANPLFYFPDWANIAGNGSGLGPVNEGDTFEDLRQASEACAIQYLNSFSLPLSKTSDEMLPHLLPLNSAANELSTPLRPAGELNRGFYLMEFSKILNYIQEKTPWTFKQIDGIQNLWKASQAGYNYAPIELTITTDETVDLRITRLAETYRMLSYDAFNGRKVLPPNLEKFSMDIYFLDLRFMKDASPDGTIVDGKTAPDYTVGFKSQVNFGGIAFRCFGCKFDFSNLLENITEVKSSIQESGGFQPKFKITVERVLPASYFGDRAFGTAGFVDDEYAGSLNLGNALNGSLDLGPFTGGVNRILSAGRRALTNVLGAPQRALNDALLGLQRRFESGVDNLLGSNAAVNSRPFEKKSVETLLNERKGQAITNDIFPGVDTRTANPIKNDIFPGVDNRKANPIKRDEFLGADVRTAAPIKNDVFPGASSVAGGKINNDVFPGDKPILNLVNQRKAGGKISSQNPYKK